MGRSCSSGSASLDIGAVEQSTNLARRARCRSKKRERIHRRHYLSLADARSDVFDYIERFHNPRMQRRLDAQDQKLYVLTQPSTKTG